MVDSIQAIRGTLGLVRALLKKGEWNPRNFKASVLWRQILHPLNKGLNLKEYSASIEGSACGGGPQDLELRLKEKNHGLEATRGSCVISGQRHVRSGDDMANLTWNRSLIKLIENRLELPALGRCGTVCCFILVLLHIVLNCFSSTFGYLSRKLGETCCWGTSCRLAGKARPDLQVWRLHDENPMPSNKAGSGQGAVRPCRESRVLPPLCWFLNVEKKVYLLETRDLVEILSCFAEVSWCCSHASGRFPVLLGECMSDPAGDSPHQFRVTSRSRAAALACTELNLFLIREIEVIVIFCFVFACLCCICLMHFLRLFVVHFMFHLLHEIVLLLFGECLSICKVSQDALIIMRQARST